MRLEHANCFDLLPTLPTSSCDLVLTDPPYGVTALEFDQVKIDWSAWWAEITRVAKPNAPIVMFAQQPFTTDLICSNRKMFRYLLVWHKTIASGFLSAKKRPLKAHEDILFFCATPGSSTYNPQKTTGHKTEPKRTRAGGEMAHTGNVRDSGLSPSDDTRYPQSVLSFPSVPTPWTQHSTQKPLELMKWLTATYSNPSDMVLDPFAGSGTTALACLELGRQFVGCEIDANYHAVALERLKVAQDKPRLLVATA